MAHLKVPWPEALLSMVAHMQLVRRDSSLKETLQLVHALTASSAAATVQGNSQAGSARDGGGLQRIARRAAVK